MIETYIVVAVIFNNFKGLDMVHRTVHPKVGLASNETGDGEEGSDFNNQCTLKSEKGSHRNRESLF